MQGASWVDGDDGVWRLMTYVEGASFVVPQQHGREALLTLVRRVAVRRLAALVLQDSAT